MMFWQSSCSCLTDIATQVHLLVYGSLLLPGFWRQCLALMSLFTNVDLHRLCSAI